MRSHPPSAVRATLGLTLLGLVAAAAAAAPLLAPNPPARRFSDLPYAPPSRLHLLDGHPGLHIHAARLVSRIERRIAEEPSRPIRLRWFTDGTIVTADPDRGAPLLLLGADAFGRDVFARLLYGARLTLALAALSVIAAVIAGAATGALAGYSGGVVDEVLSRGGDVLLVLPAMYVALAARAALPLVLPAPVVFAFLTGVFALLGFPIVARGVRAIVVSERSRDYIAAARASGASPARIVLRHLLPASRGYVGSQAVLLFPSFVIAEATLTYAGLGFPETTPTWGTLLQETSQAVLFGEAPWALAPAVAMFLVVLAVNLAAAGRDAGTRYNSSP
jgi:peptide/nickel transport system permease protein